MEYLIRFSQTYETFRLPEIQALAVIEGIDLEVISYSLDVGPVYFISSSHAALSTTTCNNTNI